VKLGQFALASPSADVKVLPVLLPKLRSEFPDMEFNLRSMSSRAELIAALLKHKIDAAFLRRPLLKLELASAFILSERFIAVLPASHPLAKKERMSWRHRLFLPADYK